MPADAANEIIYTSFYQHGVDVKRRVHLPFRWRSDRSVELTLMVSTSHAAGPCLRALPPAQLAKMRAQIEAMPIHERAREKRTLANSCQMVSLDSAGRIALPEEMMKAADLGNEVVLSGLFDYFEVWQPERYRDVKKRDETAPSTQHQFLE